MQEPKQIISLLSKFEHEAAERASRLAEEGQDVARVATAVFDSERLDEILLAELNRKAQEHLFGEQEIILVEQAAKLAQQRDHGERVMIVGMTSSRIPLVEIGIEDQDGELVVFHAREATKVSIKAYEEQTYGRL
jgi:hypothetical protein